MHRLSYQTATATEGNSSQQAALIGGAGALFDIQKKHSGGQGRLLFYF